MCGMHCTELQIGFYISDQSLYGIFGFIFGLVCPVYTHIHMENFWLSCPKLFIFAICENYLQFGWSHFMIVVLLCIGMSDHFWSLCISMCRLYTYNIKFVCGALFSISKTTVYLNCSALQTHFVSCYILQRRFNVGFYSHSLFPDICFSVYSNCLLCAHPYICCISCTRKSANKKQTVLFICLLICFSFVLTYFYVDFFLNDFFA